MSSQFARHAGKQRDEANVPHVLHPEFAGAVTHITLQHLDRPAAHRSHQNAVGLELGQQGPRRLRRGGGHEDAIEGSLLRLYDGFIT